MAASLATKPAAFVAHYRSYGEQLLTEEGVHRQDDAGTQTLVFGGSSQVLGEEAFDEEICISGRRVVWTAGGLVRKRFTLDTAVLQVAWARFPGSGAHASLCMLQQSLLTVYDLGGTLQQVPLPAGVTGMHAVPGALLLKGSASTADSILRHPLEELSQIWLEGRASAGASAWQDERVVWSSMDMPYLVTYSKVLGRLAVWSVRRGIPPAAQERVLFAQHAWTPVRELPAGGHAASPAGKKCVLTL